MESESPERPASVLIDPAHPEAGKGGVVPPVHSRFAPGNSANPGGMPKGYKHSSTRRALMRDLGKGFETDTEAEGDDDRIGTKARELSRELVAAALAGDAEKVRAIATIIDQAEGKPTETRVNKGSGKLVVVLDKLDDDDDPEELPPGCE